MSETMKILLLGDNYVGKTCLAATYCEGSFPTKTIVTIGVNVYHKIVRIDKDDIKVSVCCWVLGCLVCCFGLCQFSRRFVILRLFHSDDVSFECFSK